MVSFRPYPMAVLCLLISLLGLLGEPAVSQEASDHGRWSAVPPPFARRNHSAVYDSIRDQMIVFGGSPYNNETWVFSLADPARWTLLSFAEPSPQPRFGEQALIYDSVGDRLVMLGCFGLELKVWVAERVENTTWLELSPLGDPPSRRADYSAIYDTRRNQIVLFGGYGRGFGNVGFLNDVWILSLGENPKWIELTPQGELPKERAYTTAIYDPVRDRMVLHGGWETKNGPYEETWALKLGSNPAWVRLLPEGTIPPGIRGQALYDPVRDRMLLSGGGIYPDPAFKEVWSLDFRETPKWTLLSPGGEIPTTMILHSTIYDPVRDRMVMFGGYDGVGFYSSDVWCLWLDDQERWTRISPRPTPPSSRMEHTAVYDPIRQRMIVIGGIPYRRGSPLAEIWSLALSGNEIWTPLELSGESLPFADHTSVYVPAKDEIVVFGGVWEATASNQAWVLPLSGEVNWKSLQPLGGPPTARTGHTSIYDPIGNRMIVFAGRGQDGTYLNDVWTLSCDGNPSWIELSPLGSKPQGREGHTAVYDSARHRMLVFGGYDASWWQWNFNFNDVWTLSLESEPEWMEITPSENPTHGGGNHTAFYDPLRDRMVVHGWYENTRTLSLDGEPTWSELLPEGPEPIRRYNNATIYDSGRDQMVMFGGDGFNDTWMLRWDGAPPTPVRLAYFAAGWDGSLSLLKWGVTDATEHSGFHVYRQLPGKERERLTDQLLTGQTEYEFIDPTPPREGAEYWLAEISRTGETTWHGPVVLPPASLPARLILGPGVPNPFRSQTQITYSIPGSQHVELVIFDLQGRRIATLVDDEQGPGEYTVSWDGRVDTGIAASGLYFLRLLAGKATKTQKLMFVR